MWLQDNQLYASPAKCEVFKEEIDFLFTLIDENSITFDSDKVKGLQKLQTPKFVNDVRSFLTLLQLITLFIPNFTKIETPLRNLTNKGSGVQNWGEKCDPAFKRLNLQLRRSLFSLLLIGVKRSENKWVPPCILC